MIVALIGALLASAQASAPAAPVPPAQAAPPPKAAPPHLTGEIIRTPDPRPRWITVKFDDNGMPLSCEVLPDSPNKADDHLFCARVMDGKINAFSAMAAASAAAREKADAEAASAVDGHPHLLNAAEVFKPSDYPAEALRAEAEGTAVIRISIDPAGRPVSCRVVKSSKVATLDQASCTLPMERGRFTPAKAGARTHTRKVSFPVRWDLPPDAPKPFSDTRAETSFQADGEGKIGSCRVRYNAPNGSPGGSQNVELSAPIICKNMEQVVTSTAAYFKESLPTSPFSLVFSSGQTIGSPDGARSIGKGTGEHLLAESAVALSVDADGKVVQCEEISLDVASVRGPQNLCSVTTQDRFEPLPKGASNRSVRHAVRYMAVFTAPPEVQK